MGMDTALIVRRSGRPLKCKFTLFLHGEMVDEGYTSDDGIYEGLNVPYDKTNCSCHPSDFRKDDANAANYLCNNMMFEYNIELCYEENRQKDLSYI